MYKILLVEDDADIREVISDYFDAKSEGSITIDTAISGQQGVEKVYKTLPKFQPCVQKTQGCCFCATALKLLHINIYSVLFSDYVFLFVCHAERYKHT